MDLSIGSPFDITSELLVMAVCVVAIWKTYVRWKQIKEPALISLMVSIALIWLLYAMFVHNAVRGLSNAPLRYYLRAVLFFHLASYVALKVARIRIDNEVGQVWHQWLKDWRANAPAPKDNYQPKDEAKLIASLKEKEQG